MIRNGDFHIGNGSRNGRISQKLFMLSSWIRLKCSPGSVPHTNSAVFYTLASRCALFFFCCVLNAARWRIGTTCCVYDEPTPADSMNSCSIYIYIYGWKNLLLLDLSYLKLSPWRWSWKKDISVKLFWGEECLARPETRLDTDVDVTQTGSWVCWWPARPYMVK